MKKKINNWTDYEKLFKEERYNVSRIEDTYVYKLQEEIEQLTNRILNNEVMVIKIRRLERLRDEAIKILESHRHYSTPTEEQNSFNENLVIEALNVLVDYPEDEDEYFAISEEDDEDNLKAGIIFSPGVVFDPLSGQPTYRFSDSVTVENDVLKTTFSRDGIIDAIIKEERR